MKNTSVPLVGGFYADDTKSWSAQDCVNWLPTQAEKEGTRTPSMLKTPPGLREFVLTPAHPLTLTGHLPATRVGDTGVYQYVESAGVPPYGPLSIAVGSLPPGATMSGTGLVTYNYTTPGHYTWSVSGVDAAGSIATLPDFADIAKAQWWATVPGSNTLYYSDDLVTWNTTTRSPNVPASAKMPPLETGIGHALIFSNNNSGDEVITNFVPPITTTLGVAAFNPDVAKYYPSVGAIVALQWISNSTQGATSVKVSTDNGATFQSYALPGPGAAGITRLNNGRWLIVDGPLSGASSFRYTDAPLPTSGWVTGGALPSPLNVYSTIASNGVKAIVLNNLGTSYATTDGITITSSTTPLSHRSALVNGCEANGNTFVFSGMGTNAVVRTSDAGMTWNQYALPYLVSDTVMIYGKGTFVLSGSTVKPMMSTDDGITWTSIAALPSGAQVGFVEFVP